MGFKPKDPLNVVAQSDLYWRIRTLREPSAIAQGDGMPRLDGPGRPVWASE